MSAVVTTGWRAGTPTVTVIAVTTGWKLVGISVVTLVCAGGVGAMTFDARSPRARSARRAAAVMAVVAVVAGVITLIAGPGDWCSAGSAYRVPGCG